MKDGFVKVACASPDIHVADCEYNGQQIIKMIYESYEKSAKIIAFPELCLTGYTCGDLFLQSSLLESTEKVLIEIAEKTKELEIISIVGLPFSHMNKLYNCAAVIYKGEVLSIVPKTNIPNYSEFYEARHFVSGIESDSFAVLNGKKVNFGTNQIFRCNEMSEFVFGIEICEDLWVGDSPSIKIAQNGATLIFNLSASDEVIGKADYRRTIIKAKSGSLICGYAYANAGIGESTTDMVFSAHNIIAENGSIIAESEMFNNGITYADVDLKKISSERIRCNTFRCSDDFHINNFSMQVKDTVIDRQFARLPFVPTSKIDLAERCEGILKMQAVGLMTRLRHIGCKSAILGLSGGLDSTLALIVTVHAFDMLGLDRKCIITVTMPCFGTTDRTYNNACRLAKTYGVTLIEVDIKNSVISHFNDIKHDETIHDITYENSQARERTQVLMDIANKENGIVVGTGDLSELALGWATYNGDHMSMYAVNSSIPKTLVRYLVGYEAEKSEKELGEVLFDVLDTPVSPELLPPSEDGEILQKTEDIVGPYELHDFFLYYMMRFGYSPKKILRLAVQTFKDEYSQEVIVKWERTFYRRFFAQQFKRSCLPDGPKVGSVTLSPRSDFRMPSDACANIWLKQLDD